MQVKPGYKQTDVGVIPQDWTIEVLSRCVRGDAPICYGILMPGRNYAGGVPVIKVKDILGGRIDETGLLLTHPSIDDAYRRSRLCAGDVLITIRGTTGRVAITPQALHHANITQDTARARIKTGYSNRYLYVALQSKAVQEQIALHTIGQAVKGINIRDVKNLALPLPPTKAEQDTIAGALSDADALIESLEQLLAKKRHIKQGAMQELLTGKRRLPGFNGEWAVKPLSQIAPLQRGFDLPNSKLRQGAYPVVYSNGVLNHHVAFHVKGPGVVTGRSGTIGSVTFVDEDFWPHNTSLWVTSFKGNDPKFVFYLYTRIGLERFATGSGVPTLNRNDVHAFKVAIPATTVEQTAIATIFSDMGAEIAALESKLAKVRQIKQGMMQELLTGRIRLV